MDADLDPGWLERQLADAAALDRAHRKIVREANRVQKNGLVLPVSIEFTIPELRAIAALARDWIR